MPSLRKSAAERPLAIAAVVFYALIGVLATGVLVVEVGSAERWEGAVGLAVCAVLPAFALARARWVLPVVVATAGFTALSQAVPVGLDNTFGMVELIELAWLAVRVVVLRPVLHAVLLTPALVVAAATLPLRLADENLDLHVTMGALIGIGMPFAVLLGMYLRLHERRHADLSAFARQEQRLEYARDLHDFVAHHVTAIVAQARAVRYTTATGAQLSPEALDTMLEAIEKAGSQALTSMRGMITVLRDEAPARERELLADVLGEAVREFTGPPRAVASVDPELGGARLPAHVVDVVRNVVRESLTNVLRHGAGVRVVEVRARVGDGGELAVSVVNDGGAAAEPVLGSGGFGLAGLTERVEAAGGRLEAGPGAAGVGWRVVALLPPSLP
ncbi:hypothetical protein KCV87_04965 [Actinosynnema pretiosum subsp. pretiosum]|uniref:histidine kinase n=2 Tax=Actinosynnema TaxID=40566 RepID=C6WRT3_ACTMD|nr:histidine kinase [Actinosynnema mirum]ACU36925.1 histidine kinase [Actinosynnema mirum DSM 43827]AXX30394.1 Two-component system sensor kinase [Actinosynnema pretiosum subsp. pretiosum]QUF05457.1 hypothetical protein KCV87_04965 [Actinosynnema pretiosum subsp. pretiosum]